MSPIVNNLHTIYYRWSVRNRHWSVETFYPYFGWKVYFFILYYLTRRLYKSLDVCQCVDHPPTRSQVYVQPHRRRIRVKWQTGGQTPSVSPLSCRTPSKSGYRTPGRNLRQSCIPSTSGIDGPSNNSGVSTFGVSCIQKGTRHVSLTYTN